jgi:hypothetical protein
MSDGPQVKYEYRRYSLVIEYEDGTTEPYDLLGSEAWRSFFDIDIDDDTPRTNNYWTN